MEISVTDFSAPIGAIVFKFCVHLQEGKVPDQMSSATRNVHSANSIVDCAAHRLSPCITYVVHVYYPSRDHLI